jgi:mono/diheme cytochrome c family protein
MVWVVCIGVACTGASSEDTRADTGASVASGSDTEAGDSDVVMDSEPFDCATELAENPPDPSSADIVDGERVWAGRCAACHGAEGEGTASGPDLTARIAEARPEHVCTVFDGQGAMPPQDVTWDEAKNVVVYLGSLLADQPTDEMVDCLTWVPGDDYDPTAYDPSALYDQHCAVCHGADGMGVGDNPDVWAELHHTNEELLCALMEGIATMPAVPITAPEAWALLDWLREVAPTTP